MDDQDECLDDILRESTKQNKRILEELEKLPKPKFEEGNFVMFSNLSVYGVVNYCGRNIRYTNNLPSEVEYSYNVRYRDNTGVLHIAPNVGEFELEVAYR